MGKTTAVLKAEFPDDSAVTEIRLEITGPDPVLTAEQFRDTINRGPFATFVLESVSGG